MNIKLFGTHAYHKIDKFKKPQIGKNRNYTNLIGLKVTAKV